MTKTVTYLTLSALSMSCTLAPVQGEMFQTGIYSGMNFGASFGHMKVKQVKVSNALFGPITRETLSVDKNAIGYTGDAFVGHRWILPNKYLWGVEFGLTCDSLKVATKPKLLGPEIFAKHSLSRKIVFTPQVVGGYVFNPRWLGFVKLGPALTRFSYTIHNRITENNVLIGTQRLSKVLIGVTASIGAEYALNEEWSLTGTITHTYYPDIKFNIRAQSSSTPSIEVIRSHKVKISPSYGALKVGFVYRY